MNFNTEDCWENVEEYDFGMDTVDDCEHEISFDEELTSSKYYENVAIIGEKSASSFGSLMKQKKNNEILAMAKLREKKELEEQKEQQRINEENEKINIETQSVKPLLNWKVTNHYSINTKYYESDGDNEFPDLKSSITDKKQPKIKFQKIMKNKSTKEFNDVTTMNELQKVKKQIVNDVVELLKEETSSMKRTVTIDIQQIKLETKVESAIETGWKEVVVKKQPRVKNIAVTVPPPVDNEKFLKTQFCRSVHTKTICPHGIKCRYAHNANELNIRSCSFGAKCTLVKANENGHYMNAKDEKKCNFLHTDETRQGYFVRVFGKQ